MCWYLIDEPAETGVDPAHTVEIYNRIKALDPYHPVYLVNNRPQLYSAHIDASDILGIDPYPIPKYPITRIREYVQQANWSSRGQKPVWLVAQAFGGVEHWPRAPTAVELRNMVYQGLVQGASGVLFYRYCQVDERNIQPAALWREVQTLAGELAALTPALTAPRWQGSDGLAALSGVDLMLKEVGGGDFYLFLVNFSRERKTIRFEDLDLPGFSTLEALHRAPTPENYGGRLQTVLGPLEAGVYKLQAGSM